MRKISSQIRQIQNMDEDELFAYAKEIRAPYELVKQTAKLGRLPVVNFAAGGVATPADAALMMQLGCDGVFVGSVRLLSSTSTPMSGWLAYNAVGWCPDTGHLQEREPGQARAGHCAGGDALPGRQDAC